MGVGAFVAALLRIHLSVPLAPAALLAGAAATAAGVAVGLGTVRLRPALLAVGTWLCSWLALLAFQAFPSVFGGSDGLALPPALSTLGHYELALALVALAALAYVALARGPVGTRLRAAHERPAAAAAAGVPAARLRVQAFAFAAALGGLAGGLSRRPRRRRRPLALRARPLVQALRRRPDRGRLERARRPGRDRPARARHAARPGRRGLLRPALGALPDGDRRRDRPAPAAGVAGPAPGTRGADPAARRETQRQRAAGAARSRGEPVSLRAEGLTKRYGAVAALDGLDLLLEPGTVHALVGPNGSGKTTALRALAGTLVPDEGRVLLGDDDVTAEPVERRVELGIARTLQATAVFGPLTALESVLVGAPAAGASATSAARCSRRLATAPSPRRPAQPRSRRSTRSASGRGPTSAPTS